MPLNSSNILPAGAGAAGCGAASSASRSVSASRLIKQQFEPISSTPDLGLEMHRQGTAVARRQLVEPLAPIATGNVVTGDALGKQQSLDAIDVLDPLGDQHFALAAEVVSIFFLWRGAPSRTPRFAALIPVARSRPRRRSCSSWRAAVGATSRSTTDRRHGFRRLALQHPMKPEAVETRFLNDDDLAGFRSAPTALRS